MESQFLNEDLYHGVRAFVSSGKELETLIERFDNKVFAVTDGAKIFWDRKENLTLVVKGGAQPDLELTGEGQITVLCMDRSVTRIKTTGSVSPLVKGSNNAELKLRTHGISSPSINATNRARVFLKAFDSSMPYLSTDEFSVPMMIVHDCAKPRCSDWPDGWEAWVSDIYIGQRLVCFDTLDDAIKAVRALYNEWVQCRNRYIACIRTSGAIPKICPNVVDFRWKNGTVHMELPGDGNPDAWYSPDAHYQEPLTELRRETCTRYYLKND